MIDPARCQELNSSFLPRGDYLLLWIQAAPRIMDNHALALAIERARKLRLPLLAAFVLDEKYPGANLRHFHFLLHGLAELAGRLAEMGIPFCLRRGHPPAEIARLAARSRAVVCDAGYLPHQRAWRQQLAASLQQPLTVVETNVLIPTGTLTDKMEWSAATLRRKYSRLRSDFLRPLEEKSVSCAATLAQLAVESLDPSDPSARLAELNLDRSVEAVPGIQGGEAAGLKQLDAFVATRLDRYARERNDPNCDAVSGLSPWLHFGFLSPLTIALRVEQAGGDGAEAFLEELLVRRELAINHCLYNARAASFEGLPDWARNTLLRHAGDERPVVYTAEVFAEARTHDPCWNAAQQELRRTGYMHGYMRMYWGKKILEWSAEPRAAFDLALRLNDRYQLDGRDANGITGVAWCFGRHDRPWAERAIYGTVRCMTASGLRRKFDVDAYIQRHLFSASGQG